MKTHPHDLLLQEFASTLSGEPEELLEHLITCKRCQRQLNALLHPEANNLAVRVLSRSRLERPSEEYDPVLDRASRSVHGLQAVYARERMEALGLFSELMTQPAERRALLVRNSPRFQTWGLCQLLLRRSREQNF